MGLRFFRAGRGDLRKNLTATQAALKRNQAARNRHHAARARHDMHNWQVERRRRTKHLIELGGLAVKAGVVNLTGDERATIYGAMIWMAEKLKSEDGERARGVWKRLGKMALEAAQTTNVPTVNAAGSVVTSGGRQENPKYLKAGQTVAAVVVKP